jgi:hypothetical protein
MTPFEYKGTTFTPVVLLPSAFVAYAPCPEKCCTKVLLMHADGVVKTKVAPNPATDLMGYFAAQAGVTDMGMHPHIAMAGWSFTDAKDKSIHVPPFNPAVIPGTSVEYSTIALTTHGVVARRKKKASHTRIRVCARPGFKLPSGIDPDVLRVNEDGAAWETSSPGSHYAHNGDGAVQLRSLVAHGVRILLTAENTGKGWS